MKEQVNKDAVENIRFVLLRAERIHLRIYKGCEQHKESKLLFV